MRLLRVSNLLHKGYHVFLDNYFSSPNLFSELFANGTHATGTVRHNRRGLPRHSVKAKLNNNEVIERRKGPLLCVVYKDGTKKPVFLSTLAHTGTVHVHHGGHGRGNRNIPHVVSMYNESMGGVDLSDSLLYKYYDERRTLKWTKKVVFSLFARALLNVNIIYQACPNIHVANKLKSRKLFNISAIEALVDGYVPVKTLRHRRTRQQIAADNRHDYRRRRSCWECVQCNVGLCPTCFTLYGHRLH